MYYIHIYKVVMFVFVSPIKILNPLTDLTQIFIWKLGRTT